MADTLNFKKGVASALPAASNGQILFTTDTNELYIDDAGSHKQINANNAKSADKLNTNAGDSNTPVYFSNGKPVACTGLDLDTSGNAATATKLATSRTIQTNLASTTATSFDGTANITPGVMGILKIGNGGTGADNRKTAITNLGVFGLYERSEIGTSPNFDNPGVNGFFELRSTSETTGETGIKPYDGFGPFISINHSNAMFQLAGTSTNGFYIRGKQAANVTLAGVDWQKLLTSGNYADYALPLSGGTLTNNIDTKDSHIGVLNIVNNTTSSGGSTKVQSAMTMFNPNLPDGSTNLFMFGKSRSTNNAGYIGFNHVSNGSTSNAVTIGLWAQDKVLNICGSGNVGIGTTTPSAKLTVAGNVTTTGKLSINSASYPGVHIWGDGEGGNIRIFTKSSSTNCFEFDGYDGNLRLYYSTDGGSGATGYQGWKWSTDGSFTSSKVYGAVWNDYAEYRICKEDFKPGQVVLENGDDTLSVANQRLQRGCSIISDTFGFAIGETDEAKCPIAVSGRVLAYGYESHEEFKKHIGWPVCSGPNGTVSIMTEEEEEKYPSRIIGTVSAVPDYETWGTGNIEVDNRIWIKIK